MKIAYLIASRHGEGGHYYSLLATASILKDQGNDVLIINAGTRSQALEQSMLPFVQIPYNGCLAAQRAVYNRLRRYTPDAIHAFDTAGYLFGRLYARLHRRKIVLTKCGGPNPRRYYPFCPDLILYSQENHDYFLNSKSSRQRLYLLPQRVADVPQNERRIGEIRARISPSNFTLLRISRINRFYQDSFKRAISLVEKINGAGIPAQLIFIGEVQDERVAKELKAYSRQNVHWFNQPDFTVNANEVIDVADAVIGTGRGLMEASARQRILFSYSLDHPYPVLVTPENYRHFQIANWSMRATCPAQCIPSLQSITQTISNPDSIKKCQRFSRELFAEHFDINRAVLTLLNIYTVHQARIPPGFFCRDYLMNLYSVRKTFRHSAHVA